MDEKNYQPFQYDEYLAIKNDLASITHTLPTHLADIFWRRCNAVRGKNTPQPCTCGSSAQHWGDCVGELQKYIKRVDGQA